MILYRCTIYSKMTPPLVEHVDKEYALFVFLAPVALAGQWPPMYLQRAHARPQRQQSMILPVG